MTEKRAGTETTKVRFDLWAVLLIIVLFGGYLFDAQGKDRANQNNTQKDVAVLQEQYKNIDKKLDTLISTLRNTTERIGEYRNEVKAKKTKISDLQWK